MIYSVEITQTAERAILEQARYIAVEGKAPENARRWLEGVWAAVGSLERFPVEVRLRRRISILLMK